MNRTAQKAALNNPQQEIAPRIATVGPVGRFPIAPGTAGSVVGVAVTALIGRLPLSRAGLVIALAGASAAVYLTGVWAAGRAEKAFGAVDPGPVVIDEVAGQMVTFLVRPAAGWMGLLAGFLLFRFFDVLKPFPARRSEHLPGGWGIMTDDVAAGVYAAAALFLSGLAMR
ncbi:MAG: phosphatidylglycerophosphatase A family protein [Candidatus Acidiferrales bacterium]